MENQRLVDMINHLPAGSLLTTTPEFERIVGKLLHASILQACSGVIDAGYQDKEAQLSTDGRTISIYSGGKWVPWPALIVQPNKDPNNA